MSDSLEPASRDTKRYQAQKLRAGLASTIVAFVGLVLLAFVAGPMIAAPLHQYVPEYVGQVVLVAVVVGVALESVTLPIDFWSSYLVEHQHGLSTQTFRGWIWKRLKGYALGGVLGLLMLGGLYWILWLAGDWWWLVASAAWLGMTLVLGRLLPILILPLFYRVTKLDDVPLLDRIRKLCDGTGLTVEGVYRLHLSDETKKANAALAGLGRSRRVLLGDTLLESFTPDEIEVVFAHEVGHHVYRHLVKSMVLGVVLATVGFKIVDLVLHGLSGTLGFTGITDPAAMPLVLLTLTLFGFVLAPMQNAISRFHEFQCDRYALRRTGMKDAFRSAFGKLARMNKSDPDPNPWVVWLFYDHPPIRQRLALADE
ncbi:MAG TPA: M48 family metalloprotease [Gemmataceae bacterium]|jgi:STE24 endopeptidase|nr:M48 family metalloprotease [Gemmataceae bacterium]